MEPYDGDVSLPIRQIRDMNPTWIRGELGSLTELKNSIKHDGLMQPVLLRRSDFFVLAGARRIEAASALGWDTVPVQFADTWEEVMAYYLEMLSNERSGLPHLPMRWSELVHLWVDLLPPLRREYQTQRSREARKYNALHGLRSPTGGNGEYNEQLARMFGWRASSDVKALRDSYIALEKCRAISAEHFNAANAVIESSERSSGRGLATLRKVTQDLAAGRITIAEMEANHEASFKAYRTKPVVRTNVGTLTPRQEVERFVNLLAVLAEEAGQTTSLGDDLSMSQARLFAAEIQSNVNKLNKYRRLLVERAAPPATPNPTRSAAE